MQDITQLKKSKKIPYILSLILILSLLLGSQVPLMVKRILYGISISIQNILMSTLPFIIFTFLFNSITHFKKNALFFILYLLLMVTISNFIYTQIAYLFYNLHLVPNVSKVVKIENCLTAYWKIETPRIIPNSYALLIGIISGLIAKNFSNIRYWQHISNKLVNLSMSFLDRLFFPMIPVFILGFALKLQHDQMLSLIFRDYGYIVLVALLPAILYLSIMYLLVNQLNFSKVYLSISNMIPPTITGFITMSGAATIPSTLIAVEKNIKDSVSVKSVVPVISNIHLLGDGFFIPTIALAIIDSFHYIPINISTYLLFSFNFVIAKFAVAGVPAGGILAMLPILEKIMGFNEEMLTLILSIYIIFDPITTSINVLSNGSFAVLVIKIYKRIIHSFTSK